jgi:hypothetical protein
MIENQINTPEQLSDFWLTDKNPDLNNLFDLLKLQHAVANFVKIISGRDIPVEFCIGNEKSSIDKIIISAELTNIDATVGLAIHETLSFIYTTRWMTSMLVMLVNDDYVRNRIKPDSLAVSSGMTSNHLFQAKRRIIAEMEKIYLLIEYWRLDALAVRMAPGYKGYIAKCYSAYFQPDESIAMFIAELDTMNYLLHRGTDLIKDKFTYVSALYALLVQVVHSDIYKNVVNKPLNDLEIDLEIFPSFKIYREFQALVDINNIARLKSSDDSLNLAIQIWEIIDKAQNNNPGKASRLEDSIEKPDETEASDFQQQAAKVMKAAALDIEKKVISVSHRENLKIIVAEASGRNCSFFDNRQVKVLMLNELNHDCVWSGRYTFFDTESSHYNEKATLEGIRLGNQLAKRLQFRNNERTTRFPRTERGKIDRRLLHSIVCGNESIFYREREETFPAINLHISIDGSHSMQGKCFLQSMKTAVAIAQAAHLIRNIHIVISFRFHVTVENARLPLVLIAYNSKKDKINKIREFFPYLKASGPTPEGLCYSVITAWIEKNTEENAENYFINFYDGMPGFVIDDDCCYEGKAAMEHVRNEIFRMKRRGIQVLSYFLIPQKWRLEDIKSTFENCRYMYGDNAEMINVNALNELARSLNTMLASK